MVRRFAGWLVDRAERMSAAGAVQKAGWMVLSLAGSMVDLTVGWMVGCWAEPTVAVRVGLRAAGTAVQ